MKFQNLYAIIGIAMSIAGLIGFFIGVPQEKVILVFMFAFILYIKADLSDIKEKLEI